MAVDDGRVLDWMIVGCIVGIIEALFIVWMWYRYYRESSPSQTPHSEPLLHAEQPKTLGELQAQLDAEQVRTPRKDWVCGFALIVMEAVGMWSWCRDRSAHFRFDGWRATWMPLSNCFLPPPPPFWTDVSLGMVKTAVLAYFFGFVDISQAHDPASRQALLITIALGLYQIALVPVSIGLAVHAFFNKQGPFEHGLEAYQCAGTMAISGPWTLSLMTAVIQAVITSRLVQHSHAWFRGWESDELWKNGRGRTTEVKTMLLKILAVLLLVGFGPFLWALFHTHIGMGFLVFSPITIPLLWTGDSLTRYFGGYEKLQQLLLEGAHGMEAENKKQIADRGMLALISRPIDVTIAGLEHDTEVMEKAKRAQFEAIRQFQKAFRNADNFQWVLLSLSPMILATKVIVEISFFGMLYIYEGKGWFEAMALVLAERQFVVYGDNIFDKILSVKWQAVQFFDSFS